MPNYELIQDGRIESIADAGLDHLIDFVKKLYPDLARIVPSLDQFLLGLVKKYLGQLGDFAAIAMGIFGKKTVLGLIEQIEGLEFIQDIAENAAVDAAAVWVAACGQGDPVCEALVELGLVKGLDPVPEPSPDQPKDYAYGHELAGEIDRAPMVFFGHKGTLIMNCIARKLGNKAPVWSYRPDAGVKRLATLPGKNESGHYGFPFPDGNGINLVPESDGEPTLFTAGNADGPYQRQTFTDLVPHSYKKLKWGFGYLCPKSGRQFLGYGNAGNPGMLLEYRAGWRLFAAPGDMRFPNSLAVLDGGDVLVCSSYGGSRVHRLERVSGQVLASKEFPGWCVLRGHHVERYAVLGNDAGELWWSDFDAPMDWIPLGAALDGAMGEPCIHPKTGRMIIPAADGDNTNLYEATRRDTGLHVCRVSQIKGAGEWAAKTCAVDGRLYLGVGEHTGKPADEVPGLIFEITARKA